MVHYKFSRKINKEFASALRKRVADYFKENEIQKHGNTHMNVKLIIALSLFIVPYIIMIAGLITSFTGVYMLYLIMGIGTAFIGTGVMHDALHGSYSANSIKNKIVGFSATLVGADPETWKMQHNVLHHSYTNIEHADEDIAPRYVLRFTPNQPLRWFHKYQHFYAPFFYSLTTLVWITYKDFVKTWNYHNIGLIKKKSDAWSLTFRVLIRKIFYYGTILVLPAILLPISFGWIVLMFLSMHIVTGIILSLVFQLAHIMPTSEFIEQEEEMVEENWLAHQLLVTSNYAPKNPIVTWFTGGLNHQVEHHLFPNICHVHYPKLADIVSETAREFGIPYYAEPSVASALRSHFKMLKDLGRHKTLPVLA